MDIKINGISHKVLLLCNNYEDDSIMAIMISTFIGGFLKIVSALEYGIRIVEQQCIEELVNKRVVLGRKIYRDTKNVYYRLLLDGVIDINTGQEYIICEALENEHNIVCIRKELFFSKTDTSDKFGYIFDLSELEKIEKSRFG